MGFMDGDFNSDEARYNRQNRMNPPDFAPGQNPGFGDDLFSSNTSSFGSGESFGGASTFNGGGGSMGGDPFSGGGSMGGAPFGGGSLGGDPFGGSSVFGGAGGMNGQFGNSVTQPQMQQAQTMSTEDKIFEVAGKGFTSAASAGKDISIGFKGLTPLYWSRTGFTTLKASVACVAVGIISKMFGFGLGLDVAIGGCLSAATGAIAWFGFSEKARTCSSEYVANNNTIQASAPPPAPAPVPAPEPAFGMSDDFNDGWNNQSFSNEDSWGSSSGSDEDDDDADEFDIESDDDDDDDIWDINDDEDGADDGMSTDDALSSLVDVPKGMYTRQYLYDAFMKRLPKITPNFSSMNEIDEDDDLFLATEEKLQEAAGVAGCKEDYLPTLMCLEENLFVLRLTCDRPQSFKPDTIASELANIYSYDNGKFNPGVYAKADAVGAKCVITIFKGATALISTKDMILQVEDFFLDSNNYMPVVLGTDQLGNVIHADFKKVESVLITGMPRSGKSWFVQNILTQMCALTSPSELNIYIFDPKAGISDFKSFCLPHVKKFVSGDDNIVNTLRKVVKEEAPRRKRIIGDAKCVNIWDFKEKYPDVKLPIVYVLIDEVVTLAERMEKEVKQEFQGLLVELISQLPALGIRAFLIPHVVKNDIIAKTATDLIPCRISVMGDAGHIESSTGTKPKDFPYKLANKGDMAVKISVICPDTMFVHGPALTASNPENNEIFDYLRRVWTKLESESVIDSVARDADVQISQEELLNLDSNNVDDEIVFDSDSSSNNESSGDAEVSELFTNPSDRNLSGLSNDDDVFNMFNDDDDDFFN